jgi:hypothetical protein
MLHIGEHIYGVVDQVPGVMHVGTRIVHFNFLPCVPVGSVVVVDKGVVGEKTIIKTRFSPKSVLYAYLRLSLLWGSLLLLAIGFIAFDIEKMRANNNPPPPWFQSPGLWMMVLSLLCLFAWWYSHRLTHARYARAIELADLIGLDREYIEESFRTRGLPTSDEPMAFAPAGWSSEEKDDVYRLE